MNNQSPIKIKNLKNTNLKNKSLLRLNKNQNKCDVINYGLIFLKINNYICNLKYCYNCPHFISCFHQFITSSLNVFSQIKFSDNVNTLYRL